MSGLGLGQKWTGDKAKEPSQRMLNSKKHQKVSSLNYFSISFPDSTTFLNEWMHLLDEFSSLVLEQEMEKTGSCIKSKEKAV